jgi:hypothetical protein
MKCDICELDSEKWNYSVSYPILITKSQEIRGCMPSGDKLLRVCEKCNNKNVIFHCPETGKIINRD